MKDTIRDRIAYFMIILMLFAWAALVQDYRSETAQDTARAAQNYTDDVFNLDHVAATNLQNMEHNFACLKSSFSGGSAPSNPVAGMWWFDTTSNYLKLRNEANSAWLNVYDFANSRAPLALLATNCSRTVVAGNGISVSGTLASGNVTVSMASEIYAQLQNYTAGTRYLWHSGGREYGTTATSMTKVADLKLDRGGSLRIYFTMHGLIGARGRIYRNGSAIGTLRTAPDTLWNTYSEDISGWSAGDSVQIYASTPSGGQAVTIKDFSLRTGNVYGLTEIM